MRKRWQNGTGGTRAGSRDSELYFLTFLLGEIVGTVAALYWVYYRKPH